MTDGDDGSLRLAERNVSANLLPARGQHSRAPPRDRPAQETFKKTTKKQSSIRSIACREVTTGASELDRDDYGVDEAAATCTASEDSGRVETEGEASGPDAPPHLSLIHI